MWQRRDMKSMLMNRIHRQQDTPQNNQAKAWLKKQSERTYVLKHENSRESTDQSFLPASMPKDSLP